jgi:hypothetical protein
MTLAADYRARMLERKFLPDATTTNREWREWGSAPAEQAVVEDPVEADRTPPSCAVSMSDLVERWGFEDYG